MTATALCQEVSFAVDGVALSGHLRVPAGAEGPRPAVVLTGPFTGVKSQVTGHYAELLAGRGLVTLAFDHRNWGASGGARRQHEDAAAKLADLGAATSFLATHPAVDPARLGCVGICMGGGYALKHSAFDRRIGALAVVAGAFNDPAVMRSGMGDEAYRATLAGFAAVAQREFAGGETEYVPAVSDVDGDEAVMAGAEPFAYYGTDRSAAPGWENRVTRLSVRELLTFDAAIGADFIAPTPTLIVHGRTDDFCAPSGAQAVHDRIDGLKDLVWLDTTNHIDLYDRPAFVGPAVDRVAAWLAEHL
jgi:uncharacterized protein